MTESLTEDYQIVVDCLHYAGRHHGSVTTAQASTARLAADGFGIIDSRHDGFWDWSHVRDSSPRGVARMAYVLRHYGFGK